MALVVSDANYSLQLQCEELELQRQLDDDAALALSLFLRLEESGDVVATLNARKSVEENVGKRKGEEEESGGGEAAAAAEEAEKKTRFAAHAAYARDFTRYEVGRHYATRLDADMARSCQAVEDCGFDSSQTYELANDTAPQVRACVLDVAHRLAETPQAIALCLICLDSKNLADCTCPVKGPASSKAVADGSSSSSSGRAPDAFCGHHICSDCIVEWISDEINGRQPYVCCLMFGDNCNALFTDAQVHDVSGVDDPILDKQRRFRLEGSMVGKMHCPNPRCDSDPFKLITTEDPAFPRMPCPQCDAAVCASCKVAWHDALGCEEFGRLPDHLRTPKDITLLQLARVENFRTCPSCKTLTSKNKDGCNFHRHVRVSVQLLLRVRGQVHLYQIVGAKLSRRGGLRLRPICRPDRAH
jgi:hypothetical protein